MGEDATNSQAAGDQTTGAEGQGATGEGPSTQATGEQGSQAAGESKATPAFDAEALQSQMQAAVRSGIQSYAEETTRAQQAQQTQSQADPLSQYVTQTVAPYLGAVGTEARSALDASSFYTTADPDENLQRAKLRGKVEELHMQGRQQGQFFPRETILAYMRGGPNRKEFEEEVIQRHQKKLREAEDARVAGAGSARSRGSGPAKDPFGMNPEELDAYIGDSAF